MPAFHPASFTQAPFAEEEDEVEGEDEREDDFDTLAMAPPRLYALVVTPTQSFAYFSIKYKEPSGSPKQEGKQEYHGLLSAHRRRLLRTGL